jgi:hypothetical protein
MITNSAKTRTPTVKIFEQTAGWLADQQDPSRFEVAFDMTLLDLAESELDVMELEVMELEGDPDMISWVSGDSPIIDAHLLPISFADVDRSRVIVLREVSGP